MFKYPISLLLVVYVVMTSEIIHYGTGRVTSDLGQVVYFYVYLGLKGFLLSIMG